MWTKFYYFFTFLVIYGYGQKVDYEVEEVVLTCRYEDTKSNGFACNAQKLISITRDTRIVGVNKPPQSSLSNVMTFHAYNPNLRYIPKFLGSTFVNLQTISITKTDLRLLEFRDFRHMKKLRKLYLPENKIERIAPCVFRYVDTVELINLDGNLIKELDDDTFVNLPSLLEFSANQNKIESLESGLFRNNLMLKRISLRSNQLKHIEINFLRIKAIEMADLQFNPCISLIFEAKGKLQLREFQNQTSGRCRGPEVC